ncbi:MAG: acyl-CoA desaturase [Planctomycetota bacterium]
MHHARKRSPDVGHSQNMLLVRIANLIAVLVPFLGLIAAIILLWGIALSWPILMVFGIMYVLTAFGITVGYHRLFTHKSFKTNKPMQVVFAVLGSMSAQGPVINWVADHRRHHQHSDDEGDPHSPATHGGGLWGSIKGGWHAHMGWLFKSPPTDHERYVKDLNKDRLIVWMNRLFPVWVVLGMLIPAVLGGVLTLSWSGALLGFIWGGLVRVFFVHHVTWSVNSICHMWGTQPFESHDESRNNAIVGVLAMGEGWHNNHHAFPTSARHGLRWWEIDGSWMLIWAMSKVGLAWDIKRPSPDRILSKAV